MSGGRLEVLAKSIAEQLDSLTVSGKIKWQLKDQKYTATYKGLSFEIEGSGQNWLIIRREDDETIATIMDSMVIHNVESLLRTVKHCLTPQKPRDYGSASLEAVLGVLEKEA